MPHLIWCSKSGKEMLRWGTLPALCVCMYVCTGKCTYKKMHVGSICKYGVFSSLVFQTLSRMTDQPSPSCTPPHPHLCLLCAGITLSYLLVFLHGFWGSKLRISCLCSKHFITESSLQPLCWIFNLLLAVLDSGK